MELHKWQNEIMEKFRMFQKTRDLGLAQDIQGIVDKVDRTFIVVSEEGHRIIFKPTKVKEREEAEKEAGLTRKSGELRTESGIVLPGR